MKSTEEAAVSESGVDSVSAARNMAKLLFVAMLVGLVAGFATWLFIAVDHYGVVFLWETLPAMVSGVPAWVVPVAAVVSMTLAASAVVAMFGKRPFDMGEAEAEYDNEGRMSYRNILAGTAFSLFSLFSGAPVGPEAPLTDINGGLGTFISDRLGLEPAQVKMMAYAGVAGAFSAFFGAAPVGALLAAELISPKAVSISRSSMVAGLGAGAVGWTVYSMLGGHALSPILSFPELGHALRIVDLGYAVILGVLAAIIGLAYGKGMMQTRLVTQGLRKRPWMAALAGGAPLAVAAVISPYLLFSGQTEVPVVTEQAATFGVLVLLGLGLAKLALSAWSMSTAYFGGPIFPIIFAGTCFGAAVNLLLPGIPQGVAVLAFATGMVVAASAAPLSVTIFISLIADPVLAPAIAIAAVAAFVVRQLLAPTLPGIYRATKAAEKEQSNAIA